MKEVRFRFKNFKVYRDAKKLCKFCRGIVKKYIEPVDKDLATQINRALHSLVLNIAEGSADHSDNEFARFLGISIRSVYETVAGFDLALLYELISDEIDEKVETDAHKLVKQLSAFRNSLKSD